MVNLLLAFYPKSLFSSVNKIGSLINNKVLDLPKLCLLKRELSPLMLIGMG
jgi:hypothetical protein